MPTAEIQAEMLTKAIDSVEKNLTLIREIQAEILLRAVGTVRGKAISATGFA